MSQRRECAWEARIFEAVAEHRLGDDAMASSETRELTAHAKECDVCRDLIAVVAAIGEEYATLRREAALPSPALVYWKSQLRARREAMEKAARPIRLIEAVAIACSAAVFLGLGTLISPLLGDRFGRLIDVIRNMPFPVGFADSGVDSIVLVVLGVAGVCFVVTPIALFLMNARD